jgi:predicted RNA-binding protein with PIN domain
MPVEVLIDGYNLLHAAGLAKSRYARGELQRRRLTLLQLLGRLLDPEVQSRTTVVFDSHRAPPDDPSSVVTSSVRVRFSKAPLEADDLIEQLLREHSSPAQVLVVSSDHRLHKAARRRGATAIDSDVFLDQLEDDADPSPPVRTSKAKTPQAPKSAGELGKELAADAEAELESLANPGPALKGSGDLPEEWNDPAFWERRIRESKKPPKR